MSSELHLKPCTKLNSKCIIELKVRAKAIKTFRRKHKRNCLRPWVLQRFLRYYTKSTVNRRKKKKTEINPIKMKHFCTSKKHTKKVKKKKQHTGRKFLQNMYQIKDLSRIYKEL